MSVCWRIGKNDEYLSKGEGPCATGYVEYSGEIVYAADGETIQMVWDPVAGLPRPYTAAETLAAAQATRIAALEHRCEAYVDSLYSPRVVADAALGIPNEAFRAQVIADRTQCSADLATAIAAVNAAETPADALAVQITWAVTR